jgi:hypothetical protein
MWDNRYYSFTGWAISCNNYKEKKSRNHKWPNHMAGCRNGTDIIHKNLVTFNSETGKPSDYLMHPSSYTKLMNIPLPLHSVYK